MAGFSDIVPVSVDTAPLAEDRANDVWDDDNCVNYSADGQKLLDSFVFPSEITVREGTRIICDEAFAFQDYMCEEDIPAGEDVPQEYRVSPLDKIKLPNSVTHIGVGAFRECGYIKSIKLPTSLVAICDSAFENCWSLKSIACPASLKVIGDYAFGECFSLEKVRLNKGLVAIGPYAFFYCENLEEITFPETLEFIGEDAFRLCKSLKRIWVPKGKKDFFREMLPQKLASKVREL